MPEFPLMSATKSLGGSLGGLAGSALGSVGGAAAGIVGGAGTGLLVNYLRRKLLDSKTEEDKLDLPTLLAVLGGVGGTGVGAIGGGQVGKALGNAYGAMAGMPLELLGIGAHGLDGLIQDNRNNVSAEDMDLVGGTLQTDSSHSDAGPQPDYTGGIPS